MRVAIEKLKWQSQDIAADLPAGDVHIFCVRLNGSEEHTSHFLSMLSNSEVARARRFFFDDDRRRYIQFRGVLRALLTRYICVMPHELLYRNGTWGKPYLSEPPNSRWLKFSASRSRELALYSFACGAEVGIDIEFRDEVAGKECVFEPLQLGALLDSSELSLLEQLRFDFFGAWTAFEAFRKARGLGIGVVASDDSMVFRSAKHRKAGVLEERSSGTEWIVFEFSPAFGYAAACAVENFPRRILMQNIEAKDLFRCSFEKSKYAVSL